MQYCYSPVGARRECTGVGYSAAQCMVLLVHGQLAMERVVIKLKQMTEYVGGNRISFASQYITTTTNMHIPGRG